MLNVCIRQERKPIRAKTLNFHLKSARILEDEAPHEFRLVNGSREAPPLKYFFARLVKGSPLRGRFERS